MRSIFVPTSFLNETPVKPSGLMLQLGVAGPRAELWSLEPQGHHPSYHLGVSALLALGQGLSLWNQTFETPLPLPNLSSWSKNPIPGL